MDPRLIQASSITVCISKGRYEDIIEFDDHCTYVLVQGQKTSRDDWILEGALALQKDIHVFYRGKSGISYTYLGMVDHDHSHVTQNSGAGLLMEAVLYTTRGTSTMTNAGTTGNDEPYRFKKAIFQHISANVQDVYPRSLIGCFHIIP